MLKPGTRLWSATDTTEVVVVRAPSEDVDLRCGGWPMVDVDKSPSQEVPLDPSFSEGTVLGKRYSNEESGLEVLCVKAGPGSLSIGARALSLMVAKPLPSSD